MAADVQGEAARLMRAKDWPNALRLFDLALAAEPRKSRLLLSRAQCLAALERRADARDAATAALEHAPADARLLDALGTFLSFLGDQRQALTAFERAVAAAPDGAHYLFNRATVRRFLGRLADAEADYDRVIALRPTDFEAYKNRSDLRRQTAERNHVAELERLVARGFAEWRGEVQIRHALAKEYEDLGDYARARACAASICNTMWPTMWRRWIGSSRRFPPRLPRPGVCTARLTRPGVCTPPPYS
jgi:tetratricopeptide (TPR) repeat protein